METFFVKNPNNNSYINYFFKNEDNSVIILDFIYKVIVIINEFSTF